MELTEDSIMNEATLSNDNRMATEVSSNNLFIMIQSYLYQKDLSKLPVPIVASTVAAHIAWNSSSTAFEG